MEKIGHTALIHIINQITAVQSYQRFQAGFSAGDGIS
jgi:hypothetical protein